MSESEAEFDAAQWREELEHYREKKDEFFVESDQSPLEKAEKATFEGLGYYDPDPDYRVTAELEPVDEADIFEMEMTAGEPVSYVRVARLTFELGGETRELYAYEQASGGAEDSLFVPFRDATAGEETYGAGRYLEFHVDSEAQGAGDPDELLSEGGEVTLDFNLAYFPFCAYNDAFACPLPPQENHLDVAVEAGERFRGEE